MTYEKLAVWLCLKYAPDISIRGMVELLKVYPDPTLYVGREEHEIYQSGMLKPETAKHLATATKSASLYEVLDKCRNNNIDYLCFTDADYPKALQAMQNPPLILYFKGDLLAALRNPCLAVVGTRKPSSYGIEMCKKSINPVCEQGCTIVSGLAMGIDTTAHYCALQAKTQTIAVLAHGLDSIYPPANHSLAEKIVQNGALVSEYEPGTKVERWNFPARNRIISALSQAVFVVEAPPDSGALLTAKFAVDQARPIFALPGNINHINAQGPNQLIKAGARIVCSANDISELMGFSRESQEQLELIPQLNEEEQRIYDILSAESREISFDEFMLLTDYGFGKLSVVLLNLELKGVIAKSNGNSYIKI